MNAEEHYITHLILDQPLPTVANRLRTAKQAILTRWDEAVRETMPKADEMTTRQVRNSIPVVIEQLATALEKATPHEAKELYRVTRDHGVVRYHEAFSMAEVITEYRLLRVIVLEEICRHQEAADSTEIIAISAGLDIALQQAVLGFVEFQQEQLRAANEAEARYLSFLSHDLRNNLNNVTLTIDLLTSRLRDVPDFEEDHESLVAARRSIWETIEGMDRLMQAERLKRKAVEPRFTKLELRRIVDRVVSPMVVRAREKNIELRNEIPPGFLVHTDEQLLTLVLQNLVGNGIKYSDQGTVIIHLRQPDRSDRVSIAVTDSGQGIANADRDRLFDAFQRGKTHGQSGAGLGLAIVAAAAKLLCAEIDVTSEVGKGSTFTVMLPVEASHTS